MNLEAKVPGGPTAELLWFVAETDALRRFRSDVAPAVRGQLIAETHRWVMRDWRGGSEENEHGKSPRSVWGAATGLPASIMVPRPRMIT